jgi:hypothetical protein
MFKRVIIAASPIADRPLRVRAELYLHTPSDVIVNAVNADKTANDLHEPEHVTWDLTYNQKASGIKKAGGIIALCEERRSSPQKK